jgi:uncharacterized membrane protein YgdD (TMEM256/DUF423 family)
MSTSPATGEPRSFALSCIRAGAALMLLGVVLGAFGAHALQQVLTVKQLASYQTGVLYQQLHALALVLVGIIALVTPSSRWLPRAERHRVDRTREQEDADAEEHRGARQPPRWLGMVAPVGGISFMLAWLSLALHAGKG